MIKKCCFCKKSLWFWQDKSFIFAENCHARCHWGYVLGLLDENNGESMFNMVLNIQSAYKSAFGGSWSYDALRYKRVDGGYIPA